MLLLDVNILIYATREESPDQPRYLAWLESVFGGPELFGVPDVVLSGFLRIVTHPRIFHPPSAIDAALEYVEQIRSRPNFVPVAPGPRHWRIFADLCRATRAKGSTVPDAYLAALAIESGSEWITADAGFGRFPGLRWRHPLD